MTVQYLERDGKPTLSYVYTPAAQEDANLPAVMFLGGYRSDMEGTKALYLEEQCKACGQAYLRFDYTAHGASDGEFMDCTVSTWLTDAKDMLDSVLKGQKVILAGSSLGGWVSLLLARDCPEQVAGVVGIAAAPDFTRWITERMSDHQREQMEAQGYIAEENDYSTEPYIFTRRLIEDGEVNALLDKPYDVKVPIRLVQGKKDADVPWETAERIRQIAPEGFVEIAYVEEGDHRLSAPDELGIIGAQVKSLTL